MRVRRVIEKEVNACAECPYFFEEHDMNAIIVCCEAIDNSKDCYANVLNDISWRIAGKKISKQCPLTN